MEPQQQQSNLIRQSAEARYIGHAWAVSRGYDAVIYSNIGESIFRTRGDIDYTKEMLESSLQHFANFAGDQYGVFANFAARAWDQQSKWSIETAKHLSIVAVAGVAGTAALLQRIESLWLSISLVAFTIGLLASVLQFWLVQNGYVKQATALDTRAREIRQADSWSALVATAKPYIEPGRRWFAASVITGWLSGLSSVGAVVLLIITIWPF
ncbi:hypothetical protein [Paracandidimonas lactea]|uniref:hypothetical protein n=1 Tax=Paracandidimonas lactea TaxID=2895524 RepID=UPI001F19D664|nr:hypothetical protein [Paracandidimonas lactea]